MTICNFAVRQDMTIKIVHIPGFVKFNRGMKTPETHGEKRKTEIELYI